MLRALAVRTRPSPTRERRGGAGLSRVGPRSAALSQRGVHTKRKPCGGGREGGSALPAPASPLRCETGGEQRAGRWGEAVQPATLGRAGAGAAREERHPPPNYLLHQSRKPASRGGGAAAAGPESGATGARANGRRGPGAGAPFLQWAGGAGRGRRLVVRGRPPMVGGGLRPATGRAANGKRAGRAGVPCGKDVSWLGCKVWFQTVCRARGRRHRHSAFGPSPTAAPVRSAQPPTGVRAGWRAAARASCGGRGAGGRGCCACWR